VAVLSINSSSNASAVLNQQFDRAAESTVAQTNAARSDAALAETVVTITQPRLAAHSKSAGRVRFRPRNAQAQKTCPALFPEAHELG
jgi:hypothetical protein